MKSPLNKGRVNASSSMPQIKYTPINAPPSPDSFFCPNSPPEARTSASPTISPGKSTTMKFFSELKSCYRPQGNPASPAPPSTDDGHCVPPDLQRISRSRVRRPRPRHWRPALSVIIEDQDSSLDRKSEKKSCSKSRSTGKIRFSYQRDHCIVNPNPMTVSFTGFAATPLMF